MYDSVHFGGGIGGRGGGRSGVDVSRHFGFAAFDSFSWDIVRTGPVPRTAPARAQHAAPLPGFAGRRNWMPQRAGSFPISVYPAGPSFSGWRALGWAASC